jgi:hypothetical protein
MGMGMGGVGGEGSFGPTGQQYGGGGLELELSPGSPGGGAPSGGIGADGLPTPHTLSFGGVPAASAGPGPA